MKYLSTEILNTKYLLVQNTLAQNAQYLALSTLALQMPLHKILITPVLHNTFIIFFVKIVTHTLLALIQDCRMIGRDKVIAVSSIGS